MTREEVYRLIDGEREYQKEMIRENWSADPEEHDRERGECDFISFIQDYADLASRDGQNDGSRDYRLTCVRKIAALAVACMEAHGAPERIAAKAGEEKA